MTVIANVCRRAQPMFWRTAPCRWSEHGGCCAAQWQPSPATTWLRDSQIAIAARTQISWTDENGLCAGCVLVQTLGFAPAENRTARPSHPRKGEAGSQSTHCEKYR